MAIADRFVLRVRLGGGAAADVHRAFDQELDRDVVVRIVRAEFAANDEYVTRFQREAEAATGIRHPNVVEVLDHGVIDGRPFLVRELVEGSTLDDLVGRHGPLPEEDARALAEQIARGVEAAHARGVLHRDLNAGNVFVTPDGTAKVVDFGMPTVPRHPAPEQISREQVDERTDVYGVGALLFQMLTGNVPRGRLVPPRQLAAHVSGRLEAIALRALESDPARRYATAAEMADALAPDPVVVPIAPVARPTLVPPAAPTERTARPASIPARRKSAPASPLILLVIPVLLALLVGAFTLARPAPTNTAVLSATTTPQATTELSVLPAPTSLPPVETTPEPTTEPTTVATPVPTAEPAPPMPAPTLAPVPPPAAVPAPPAPPPLAPIAPSPAASVVLSFYELITQERFDEAAALWSRRMQANYPPSTNIYGRFDRTREIVIREIAPVAQNGGGATVAIDILEVLDSGVTRRWVGQWYLVWDGSRWLMDAPNLRAG